MSEDEGTGDVFDVVRVRALVELMIEHGLTEVDLRQHGQTIRLRRGGEGPIAYAPFPAMGGSAPMSLSGGSSAGGGAGAQSASTDEDLILIKSPMVGTYYNRPSPEAETFVKVGQDITADTTVCIIEAMKVFNPIAADVSGKIVAILVDNEEPVEYGKPLFKVRPVK